MAPALAVAATHFTPTTEDTSETEKELQDASEGQLSIHSFTRKSDLPASFEERKN
jgi:hypothetical protein